MGIFNKNKVDNPEGVEKSVKFVRDSSGLPTNTATEIELGGGSVSLIKSAKNSAISLEKQGLSGIRADCVVLLDYSFSMDRDYSSGRVQALLERALGFGLQFDDKIEVIPFADYAMKEVDVTLSNYVGIVAQKISNQEMGSTNLTDALEAVKKRAKKSDKPLFVCVITDGEPNDRSSARRVACELSRYPVFLKFMAIRPVGFLEELDDLPDTERFLDNIDTKFFRQLDAVSDKEFADAMADEWGTWVSKAIEKGILAS